MKKKRFLKLIILSREILDGLRKHGFRTNMGFKDAGLLLSVMAKAGGYYMGWYEREKKKS